MSHPLDLAAVEARTAPATFKDAWQARLERWYAHPGLYRWSLGNPLTRGGAGLGAGGRAGSVAALWCRVAGMAC
eukprot:gene29439-36496_t